MFHLPAHQDGEHLPPVVLCAGVGRHRRKLDYLNDVLLLECTALFASYTLGICGGQEFFQDKLADLDLRLGNFYINSLRELPRRDEMPA